ncbi:Lin1244/Lin1753 domain-containing protein [Xylanibacter ruminicola]|uniref:Lin1244/Lin1753 domain-containing protein n=1 Tax=Xylanibacter ruminicola TaxID=839 RepID=UPI000A5D87C5|nr:Lin1244/Lin1753 domain-containing protein [Xylanibacter ruminicola]
MLSKPEMTDLVNEQGAVGFGVYMMIVLYLSQCDDYEGAYTNGQLQSLADQARKSRAYIRHIIEDYGLFKIEGKRFHESFMNQYSHARTNRYAREEIEIDIEKENKEKGTKVPDMIGPSAYEMVTREGRRQGGHGEPVPWWAPPQRDVYMVWSLVADRWVPPAQIDAEAERQRHKEMKPADFMMKTAWEVLTEDEQTRIQDNAKRQ